MALSGVGVAAQYSLVHGVGQDPAFLGVLSALLGAGSIIASLTASRIIERFGERTLALIGLFNFALGNLLRANHSLPAALVGYGRARVRAALRVPGDPQRRSTATPTSFKAECRQRSRSRCSGRKPPRK